VSGGDRLDPPVSVESIFDGQIVALRVATYRRPHGALVRRELMEHPGGVAIAAIQDGALGLVRQPREAVQRMLLELPAGKLDVAGEPPLECAKRELAEELGVQAAQWDDLGFILTSPAVSTEVIHLFLATDISPHEVGADTEEEIERIWWPMARVGELIDGDLCDAKSLAALVRLFSRSGAWAASGLPEGLW
jgi:8-oxo-dGTP pyrophosphatase MutT (NUDIX family)